MADCAACGRPQHADTALVCHRCATRLAGQLIAAADLWPELQTTIAGQARMADPGPRSRGHAPPQPIRPDGGAMRHYADQVIGTVSGLPFRWNPAEVRDSVRNTVTTWVRHIATEKGTIEPIGTTPTLLRWLAEPKLVEWLRHQPWADEAMDELGDACRLIAPAVDRPADRRWLGVCGAPDGLTGACPGQLHARPGASTTRCPECGTGHDVAERRRWLDGMVRERAYTAAEIGAAYEHVPASTIRRWASEGRIVPHGHDKWGRPLYPLAEVLALAARPHRRKQPSRERIGA